MPGNSSARSATATTPWSDARIPGGSVRSIVFDAGLILGGERHDPGGGDETFGVDGVPVEQHAARRFGGAVPDGGARRNVQVARRGRLVSLDQPQRLLHRVCHLDDADHHRPRPASQPGQVRAWRGVALATSGWHVRPAPDGCCRRRSCCRCESCCHWIPANGPWSRPRGDLQHWAHGGGGASLRADLGERLG